VHLYGQCAEMSQISAVAKAHGLFVIEDAAQAIGAQYQGKAAGTMSDIGCFSFFPSKNLGAFGDAGLVTTQNPELYQRLKMLRVHGAREKYYHDSIGGNFRIDALQAAVLRVKLRYLEGWSEGRQKNARRYRELFAERGCAASGALVEPGKIALPLEAQQRRHIYNQFVVRAANRDKLLKHLRDCQIGCEVYYPVPLHLQQCFTSCGYAQGSLPVSEAAADETLAIPVYPELKEEQLRIVVDAVCAGLG